MRPGIGSAWTVLPARVWAAGDLTGRGAFTHLATYQADIVVREILGRPGPAANYGALPRVTFADPEIGAVGLTEQQARDQGLDVAIGLAQSPSTTRGWIHKAGNKGVIKLVADRTVGVLLGATFAGPAAGEVLGALAVAVHARVPVALLREMIYAYRTFHRGIQDALRGLNSNPGALINQPSSHRQCVNGDRHRGLKCEPAHGPASDARSSVAA